MVAQAIDILRSKRPAHCSYIQYSLPPAVTVPALEGASLIASVDGFCDGRIKGCASGEVASTVLCSSRRRSPSSRKNGDVTRIRGELPPQL